MTSIPVPTDPTEALSRLRVLLSQRPQLEQLSREQFVRGWTALAYLAPGLHGDGFEHPDSGWPEGWRCFAKEAFRRADADKLSDGELYPAAAAHAGLAAV